MTDIIRQQRDHLDDVIAECHNLVAALQVVSWDFQNAEGVENGTRVALIRDAIAALSHALQQQIDRSLEELPRSERRVDTSNDQIEPCK